MAAASSQHRKGVVLVVAAAIAWSTAPFFTRLLPFDSRTILFWRGLFAGGLIMIVLLPTARAAGGSARSDWDQQWRLACRWALGARHGLVHPGFAIDQRGERRRHRRGGAELSRPRSPGSGCAKRPGLRTLLASLVAFCGVAIIVGAAAAPSDLRGVGLACLMTLAVAAMTVAIRRYRQTSMVAAAALSNILGSLVSIPFAHGITSVTASDILVLAMFGCCQSRWASLCSCSAPAVAVRPGRVDRDPGDTADAVLGVAGFSRGSNAPRPGRRRAGDGAVIADIVGDASTQQRPVEDASPS